MTTHQHEELRIEATGYAHVGPDGERLAVFDTLEQATDALYLLQLPKPEPVGIYRGRLAHLQSDHHACNQPEVTR